MFTENTNSYHTMETAAANKSGFIRHESELIHLLAQKLTDDPEL